MLPHVSCPSCGKLSVIDYTTKGQKYTWRCHNDDCGKQYSFVQNEDGTIDAEPTGVVVERCSVLLKMPPQKENVFLIVRGTKSDVDNQVYFYNEHTCPTNYFSEVEELYLGDREDPHGLFEFVGSIDKREDVTKDDFDV